MKQDNGVKNNIFEGISPLGFGVMRLPMEGDWFSEEVYDLLSHAIEIGINYFDMGYTYQNGQAEKLVREAIVKKYPRDRFYIATKMPTWEVHNRIDFDNIFNSQLENLGVRYIDYYLVHLVTKFSWTTMKKLDVIGFLMQKRREGRIGHIGFSFHDTPDVLRNVLDDFAWDFVQIQCNYLDWNIRNAKELYKITEERKIPCVVMEPLAGGQLSNLPEEIGGALKNIRPKWTLASWGMRFVASLPNVKVILSGMNTIEQLEDNANSVFSRSRLTEEEKDVLEKVCEMLKTRETIPCSSCGYCLKRCPQHIQIPGILQAYNESKLMRSPSTFLARYDVVLATGPRADACVQCRRCVDICPQKIDIPSYMRLALKMAAGLNEGEGRNEKI